MKLSRCYLSLFVVTILLSLGASVIAETIPADQRIQLNVMVPMRDGVRLSTNIFMPKQGGGPWPVILMRTPYNKGQKVPGNLTQRGYVAVTQDFRGRFASEGEDMPFLPDAWGKQQDGYDTIEWIAKQPWCNGKVCTTGGSALGMTQCLTAPTQPPHLVSQEIIVGCGSVYDVSYQGGTMRKSLVEDWLTGQKFSDKTRKMMLAGPTYTDFWKQMDTSTRKQQINVPGLFIGGWYDIFCQPTLSEFMMRQYQAGPGARGKQRMVMGPWTHGIGRSFGQFSVPDNAKDVPPEAQRVAWFDHYGLGLENGAESGPAVIYYTMGSFDEPGTPGNEWRTASGWPVPCTYIPYYLHSGGRLSTDQPAVGAAATTYSYNPKNPVPTLGGCNLTGTMGPYVQNPLEKRPDVLLYTTSPLAEPVEITGHITARLWASSDCRDTDFTVKLTDIYPDGRSVLLQDGIIRARYRNSVEREELMQPGTIYPFDIDVWSTSIIINKGHCLRVAVSSSNWPRFDTNPNTGDPFRANKKTRVARNTIYQDAAHASYVLLPLVR